MIKEPQTEIRGLSTQKDKAPPLAQVLAVLLDFSVVLIFLSIFIFFGMDPIPNLIETIVFLMTLLSLGFFCLRLLKRTPGESLWSLQNLYSTRFTLRQGITGSLSNLKIIALTLVTFFLSSGTLGFQILSHPYFVQPENQILPAFVPAKDQKEDWLILPFYYSLGAWPRNFSQNPILYTLPYQKGPPKRFAGHIFARWKMPDIRFIYEGPRTPTNFESPERIKNCLSSYSISCVLLRKKSLSRHITEMKKHTRASRWEVKWFEVENSLLPQSEIPRGIYLLAHGKNKIQERYVLINDNGRHQALVLSRKSNPDGKVASELLKKSIGSLRIWRDLEPGRAWVDMKLKDTKLKDSKNFKHQLDFVKNLAEVQATLVSKISVQPRSFQAYFHLGGTAFMLSQYVAELRNPATHLSDRLTVLMEDWAATSKPLVYTSLRYARDLKPNHPYTHQLEGLWLETKKKY